KASRPVAKAQCRYLYLWDLCSFGRVDCSVDCAAGAASRVPSSDGSSAAGAATGYAGGIGPGEQYGERTAVAARAAEAGSLEGDPGGVEHPGGGADAAAERSTDS